MGWFLKRHKLAFSMVAVASVLVILGIAGYRYYDGNLKSVLVIGDVSISKTQYDNYIAQASEEDLDADNARTRLIELQKTIVAGDKLKVVVDDEDQSSVLLSRYGFTEIDKANDWQLLTAKAEAIEAKVATSATQAYSGAIYEFPFSRNFDTSYIEAEGEDFGKPDAIEADKKYAKQQAEAYRKKLAEGSISPTQAIKEIKEDERLILGSSGNKSIEFAVDKNGFESVDSINGDHTALEYIDTLKGLKPGEISPIQTKKVLLSYYTESEPKEPKEALYYFIQLKSTGDNRPNLQADFKKTVKEIKVVENDKDDQFNE